MHEWQHYRKVDNVRNISVAPNLDICVTVINNGKVFDRNANKMNLSTKWHCSN